MISLNAAVQQYLDIDHTHLVFVFIHPSDGLAIVVRDPLSVDLGLASQVRIDFPIGETVLPNLTSQGVLAPLLSRAIEVRIGKKGTYVLFPDSFDVCVADLTRAFHFLRSLSGG